jgi:hypothetical protein
MLLAGGGSTSTPISRVHKHQNVRRAILLVSFLLFPVTFYYLSPYPIIMSRDCASRVTWCVFYDATIDQAA